jgi:hypothetical protein
MANKNMVKKRNRTTKKIPYEEGFIIKEAIQLVGQLNQPLEDDGADPHVEVELPSQSVRPVARAPPRCSGCGEIEHKIKVCKNRYI